MGSCCGTASDTALEDDQRSHNPLPPHDDWLEQLKADLGTDPTAIARDFPRMDVDVKVEQVQVDPPSRQPEAPDDSSPGYGQNKKKNFDDDPSSALVSRRARVITSLVNIAKLCDPPLLPQHDSVTGIGAESPNGKEVEREYSVEEGHEPGRGEQEVQDDRGSSTLLGPKLEKIAEETIDTYEADLSHSLHKTLVSAGLLLPKESAENSDAPVSRESAIGSASPVVPTRGGGGKDAWVIRSNSVAIKVLLCFGQGIMFYPSQRLRHLIWQPWALHLRDVGWNATVFRPSADPDSILVWHEQSVKNHVSDSDRDIVPQFRLSWRLELVLDAATGDVKTATVTATSVRWVTKGKGKVFKRRQEHFEQKVLELFGFEVEPVAAPAA